MHYDKQLISVKVVHFGQYVFAYFTAKSKAVDSLQQHQPKTIYQLMDEWVNGKPLEEADQFKYLGSTETKDGTSIKEAKIKLTQACLAMTRSAILWKNNAISVPTKIKLNKSFVLSTLLSGCASWRLTADQERRMQAFENKCLRILGIKQTNMYGSRLVSSPDIISFYCQP